MEEILAKANELGLMIKGSEVYTRFADLSQQIENNDEARVLLEEFVQKSNELSEKEKAGHPVEVHEKEEITELSEKVAANDLIKEFIATQTYYYNLVIMVQKIINDPQGDPITESKIVKPGNPGKIITDF
ncbi:MAG TPA: YlbF family regulator [Spirochaetota bacterium]|nr:YlbF family regulator [Spirochaetota bacterium]HPJ40309.1 YlbF family regulator [Spirochaetota bacterium]HPQ52345.1 YlbF family regulator [Spirochaetota bacterium]